MSVANSFFIALPVLVLRVGLGCSDPQWPPHLSLRSPAPPWDSPRWATGALNSGLPRGKASARRSISLHAHKNNHLRSDVPMLVATCPAAGRVEVRHFARAPAARFVRRAAPQKGSSRETLC